MIPLRKFPPKWSFKDSITTSLRSSSCPYSISVMDMAGVPSRLHLSRQALPMQPLCLSMYFVVQVQRATTCKLSCRYLRRCTNIEVRLWSLDRISCMGLRSCTSLNMSERTCRKTREGTETSSWRVTTKFATINLKVADHECWSWQVWAVRILHSVKKKSTTDI